MEEHTSKEHGGTKMEWLRKLEYILTFKKVEVQHIKV